MKWKYATAVSIRLAVIFLVIPSYLGDYFAPFLNGLSNYPDIWSHWLDTGGDYRSFPYGIAMLLAYIPSLIFSQLLHFLDLGPVRSLEISVGLQMLAAEVLLWKHLAGSRSMKKSVNIFLFSPLIIWVNYFLGLNDFFPSICLFFGSYLLLSKKYRFAGVLIGIAIGMKFSLALVLPFLFLFAWDNPRFKKNIWITALISLCVGGLMYAPGLYSQGFRIMVFNNPESMKAFDYFLVVGSNKLLILPLIYMLLLYWLWKAGRISAEVLVAFFGIALFLISAFSPASIGWMLWGMPLMFMNLANQRKSRIQLTIIQLLFLAHHIFSGVEIRTIYSVTNAPILIPEIMNIIFSLAIVLVTIWSYSSLRAAIRIGDFYKIAKSPLTVSISGDSGTGKDTLTNALTSMFTKETASVICGDDYHKFERGDDSWKNTTHLNPTANYLDLWERDYLLAHSRQYFEQREYDHETGKFTQLRPRLSRDLLISQGLHALYERLSNKSDLRIFLSMDDSLRIKLKLQRDSLTRNQNYESIIETIQRRKTDYESFIYPQITNANIHFYLSEDADHLNLQISSTSNSVIDDFMRNLTKETDLSVQESTDFDIKIYNIRNTSINEVTLKKILRNHLSQFDQLFLQEPRIPEGAVGLMAVLTVVLIAKSREDYYA